MEISHFTCPYAWVVPRSLLVPPLFTCLRDIYLYINILTRVTIAVSYIYSSFLKWLVSILVLELQDQDFSWGLESYLVSRPRPEPPGLETKTKTLATRSRDQDLSLQVASELEFETLGLEITSLVTFNVPSKLCACACAHRSWDEHTQENLERT